MDTGQTSAVEHRVRGVWRRERVADTLGSSRWGVRWRRLPRWRAATRVARRTHGQPRAQRRFRFAVPSTRSFGESRRVFCPCFFGNVRVVDVVVSLPPQPSAPALFEFVAADIVRTDSKVELISQLVEFPPEVAKEKLFIINAQVRMQSLVDSRYRRRLN